jgi:hypothetical protein
MVITNFKAFNTRLNEAHGQTETSSEGNPISIVYDEKVSGGSKKLADKFLSDLKSADGDFSKIETSGHRVLSGWNKSWEKRASLDKGELKKENGWYTGKGAWRINSNKAIVMGLKPEWMTWEDPLHQEILDNFFPELKGERQDIKDREDIQTTADELELDSIDLPDWVPGQEEKELIPVGESLKYIKRIYENDEFTLGPPTDLADEAVVVTPPDLIEMLVDNYNMRHRANMMIWGAPGIGKTEIVKQARDKIQEKLGKALPVMIVTLAQMQPYDLNGIPLLLSRFGSDKSIVTKDEFKGIEMNFAIPAWLPGEDESEEGILFFDEINRADPDMLSASLTLLLDRQTQGGRYIMPNGWRIWAAGNREMDGPVTPFEAAVASRFLGGHVHLVPTIESWIKWARSPGGFYKDIEGNVTEEYFVPNEFIQFLKHSESEEGKDNISRHFDLDGDNIKTDFKQFYKFDKSKLTSGGEGVAVGFPTPRNWTVAFKNIYDLFLTQDKYQDQISPDVDSKNKAISAFELILSDARETNKMQMSLKSLVGTHAAASFLDYVKVLARHSDSLGTLSDKLANIFNDPTKPRPLLDIDKVKDPSERKQIMGLVEATIESMGTSFGRNEFINWTKYLSELPGKVPDGELAAHASQVISGTSKHITSVITSSMEIMAKYKRDHGANMSSSEKQIAMAMKPFIEQFREITGGFKNI